MKFYKKIWFWVLMLIIMIIIAYAYISFINRKPVVKKSTYTGIESSKFPVVYTKIGDKRVNPMNGYTEDIDNVALFDTLTVLDEDRIFHGVIRKGSLDIKSLEYEIRTMDSLELIDKGEIKEITADDGTEMLIDFPIQNLLSYDREYRFDLKVILQDGTQVHYYTRLLWGKEVLLKEMLDLADDFSTKNFDYTTARENTMYLESDATGDNSNLGRVDLKSSFDQLTYRNMKPVLVGRKSMRVSIYDGYIGEVSLAFLLEATDENEEKHTYEVRENFSFRKGPERIYMLDYTRTMNEKFSPVSTTFEDNKINLGIHDDGEVSAVKSANNIFHAFTSNKELFFIDDKGLKAKKIYSLLSDNIYSENNLKVLNIDTEGNVNFMQYGYMSNGSHEGQLGILFLKYSYTEDKINEPIFIPLNISYEEIENGVKELNYMNNNNILYIKIDNDIYSIDMNTNSYNSLAIDLKKNMYAISPLKKRIAWKAADKEVVYFMNLDTDNIREIAAESNTAIYPRGFIDNDLILGIRDLEVELPEGLYETQNPCTKIEIIDDGLSVQVQYDMDGNFLDDIFVDSGRIHLNVFARNEYNKLIKQSDDTIVCNTDIMADNIDSVNSHISDKKAKLFFLQLPSNVGGMEYTVDERGILHEEGDNLTLAVTEKETIYLAYGKGEVIGIYTELANAIKAAYEFKGSVWYKGILLYARIGLLTNAAMPNPSAIAANIIEKRTSSDSLELKGLILRQALYYIKNGYYIVADMEDRTSYIIYAYDNFNVSMYNVSSGQNELKGLEEAAAFFERGQNDFTAVKY